MGRIDVATTIAAGLALAACAGGAALSEEPAASTAASSTDASKKVTLTIGAWHDVEKRVSAHRGKVVLVSVWTTTCGACKKEMPHVLALQERFPAEKLALLTVACDYDGIPEKPPEFYAGRVRDHLATQKLGHSEHLLMNVPFADFLDQRKLRSTPAIYLFGLDGKLARRFDNDEARREADEYTIEQVRQKIAAISAD